MKRTRAGSSRSIAGRPGDGPGVVRYELRTSSSGSSSGVFGIVVSNEGGPLTRLPSPSPLPDGFGLGQMDVGPPGATHKIVVEPYPYGVTLLVRATEGPNVGKTVAQIPVKAGQDTFRVGLPPGKYLIFNNGWVAVGTTVTVHAAQYSRVIVLAGIRHE